ncbi:MAG: hypothetical protein A4E19_17055 [Nitrospira sp. SG-bin1]|nr:MAG: hypothetical protein A4E19_17055 [Nitrospira sp. SG-bin1]
MIRTMTVMKQYLSATFMILIGLITYGCGDSATVNPAVELASLTVSTETTTATLTPPFSPATTDYTVDLTNNITSVTVSAQPAVSGDTVSIDGQTTTSRVIDLGQPVPSESTKLVRIVVSESDTNSRTYTVQIKRPGLAGNNSLQNLTVSPGTPPLVFNENTLNYAVSVGNTVNSVTVTPTLQDPSATMTVNGQPTTSGQARTITPLNPPGQNTTITILVKAQNGAEKPYTISVSRGVSNNNNLQNLTISPGTLNFRANVTSYTVNVGSNVTSVTVTPTLQDPTATLAVTSNGPGPITTSGQARTIPLRAAGLSTTINILVRAQNGSEKPYTITVDRAAPPPPSGNNNLSALTVRLSASSPNLINFSSNTTSYTVDVGSGVSTITVTPTPQDPAATVTVTSNGPGPITTSGQTRTIPLRAAGLTTSINIVVRAVNGSEKPYVITVDRAAPPPPSGNSNLQNLTVSPGTLSPPFSTTRTRTDYVVNDVPSSATSILVTATPQDSSATVLINTQGGNSRSIPLPTGPSTTDIDVLVRAPNGNEKAYSITVNQPAPAEPPAPSSAPDLISADDSCLPTSSTDPTCDPQSGTTREDNITNVTSPRFSVAAPPAGATPNLYVGLVPNPPQKVPATFDVTTNTLRPNTPLSDGTYTITYTLSNAGGESNQSPAMLPQLQINGAPPPPPGP